MCIRDRNGSLVHISEFEPKHPQIQRRYNTADAIALQNTRPQRFQQPQTMKSLNPTFAPNDNTIVDSGGAAVTVVNVSLPGNFDFQVNRSLFTGNGITTTVASMVPQNPSEENRERLFLLKLATFEWDKLKDTDKDFKKNIRKAKDVHEVLSIISNHLKK